MPYRLRTLYQGLIMDNRSYGEVIWKPDWVQTTVPLTPSIIFLQQILREKKPILIFRILLETAKWIMLIIALPNYSKLQEDSSVRAGLPLWRWEGWDNWAGFAILLFLRGNSCSEGLQPVLFLSLKSLESLYQAQMLRSHFPEPDFLQQLEKFARN